MRLGLAASAILLAGAPALAADALEVTPEMLDPAPISRQAPAVDGINFKIGAQAGFVGDYSNHMLVGSVATPFPYFSQFGAQIDFAAGLFGHDYTSSAAGLHLFWRDPSVGLFGIYGDWSYVNPEHAGRVVAEGALYLDRYTFEFIVGPQFGQHVKTKVIDELDLNYYFTDNFKGSVGHRYTSRGHVANVGFEYMWEGSGGVSLYGEVEAGEDNYAGGFVGVRYSFGQSSADTLIERDRYADPRIRIPRNLASVSRCGRLPQSKPRNWWRSEQTVLCASDDELVEDQAKRTK